MTERTDRELLELAAKAAGIRLEWDGPTELWQPMYYEGKTYHAWDPLLDDGDALRLAVKLGFTVEIEGPEVRCPATIIHCAGLGGEILWERHGARPKYATRRAIVRVAATMAEGESDGKLDGTPKPD